MGSGQEEVPAFQTGPPLSPVQEGQVDALAALSAATGAEVVPLEQEVDPVRPDSWTPLDHVDHGGHDESGDRAEDVERRQNHAATPFFENRVLLSSPPPNE